ncbi:Tetratricopeptide repeat protein [Candidatus Koribacter versatilis Ellin345]|uniref:Tetratricopeptide repeat protein n=1 Tax=Koribacter versatilis (strain Ellin345) TaxID=204669 RepID=Q1IT86_KORVE|nr:tetratricopeptide repeat protein [Candidatus Koribacter versatilis]ABF39914.1 Tetratricopeptide repeat protein [Candidatus Koribacter versatilis Ellin345]
MVPWALIRLKKLSSTLLSFILLLPYLAAQQTPRAQIESLIRSNQLDAAEQQLFSQLQAHPSDGWALDLLGTVRLKQKRTSEATALFHRAHSLNTNDSNALRGLAESAAASETFDDAIAWYTKLLELNPTDLASRKQLALLQEKAGRYADSVATIQKIPVASRSADLLPTLASDYLNVHQEQKLAPLVQQVVKLGPANSNVMLDFVAVLVRNGYIQDSEKILQIARPSKPTAKYLHTLARVREAQDNLPEASKLFQQALQLDPKSFDLLFDGARFSGQHNRWDEAVGYLQKCDEVNPDRPEVLLKLTLAYLKTRRREKAVSVARRLASVSPNDPNAQYILAFALVENELWETAEPMARKAVEQNPKDANSQLLMGIIHLNKGELDAARVSFDETLRLDPNLLDAHYYSALVSDRKGDVDAARTELDALVVKNPDHANAQAELGVLRLRAGDAQGARAALEAAVRLQPEASQTHYQLGLVYARLGLQDESKAQMAEFQKLREAEDNLRKREAGVKVP